MAEARELLSEAKDFKSKQGGVKKLEIIMRPSSLHIYGAQLLILKAAQDMATLDKDQSYSLPEPSLEHHILREIDMVKETGRAQPSHYPSEDQKALSKGFICFDDVVCFEGPEDMFDRLHSHLQHISEEPLGECKSDLRTMPSSPSITLINGKPVLLLRDEGPKELKTNGWIPVVKFKFSSATTIILAGDIKQLQPTVISASEMPGWYELGLQLQTPLVTKLSCGNHPVIQLHEQCRFPTLFSCVH
ncbi:hypothetical protein BDV34DRAFT_218706 [Aspergillus parasiticus]|uniref:DNA2/NAM7 helicase helicase domain-containing protein n=1 Tax=Aspergillus parasiticus TaxID=5067 RepID=A0A5N6E422_ASPPA|nr:hypothetical protein BDV34DRAFT_218706 [Aspergillus parasiticus]